MSKTLATALHDGPQGKQLVCYISNAVCHVVEARILIWYACAVFIAVFDEALSDACALGVNQ